MSQKSKKDVQIVSCKSDFPNCKEFVTTAEGRPWKSGNKGAWSRLTVLLCLAEGGGGSASDGASRVSTVRGSTARAEEIQALRRAPRQPWIPRMVI